jgi:para-aminobenzoate synthetase / 4-amino-4-deoxychorismate lyase
MGARAGGCDLVCSEPTAICCEPELPWPAPDATSPHAAGPAAAGLAATAADPGRPAFGGGWIGYLGFGLAGRILPAPPAPGRARRLPSWWLGYYDHVLRRDRASGHWFFEALWTPDRASALALLNAIANARSATNDRRPSTLGSISGARPLSGPRSCRRTNIAKGG